MAGTFPHGVSPSAAETARDTLGGAVVAAEGLPNPLGSRLIDASREAFAQALQLTAATSAAMVLGMAVLAVILLRNARADPEPEWRSGTDPL
jgi:DHA2 family multidrug resistance protein-like MFS transporter